MEDQYTLLLPNETTAEQVSDQADELLPIGDDEAGGVVAYALPAHGETIVDRLNEQ